jgi:uncharacterized membrane protein
LLLTGGMPRVSTIAAGALALTAGTAHFVRPDFYEAIVPDWFPHPRRAIYASGAVEVGLAFGLFHPRTRRTAALGLIIPLVISFPVGVDVAVNKVQLKSVDGVLTRRVGTSDGRANWMLLPIHLALIGWMWREASAAAATTAAPKRLPG